MTKNFTEVELLEIISCADELITALDGTNEDLHRDNSTKMCETWDHLNDNLAPPAVVKALAQELLAARMDLDGIKRDAIRYRFLRESDYFGAEDEVGLASWDDLCDLNCNDFDAAVDARMNHPNSLYTPMLQNIEDGK